MFKPKISHIKKLHYLMILLTPEIEKIRESQKRKKKNIPGCYYYGFLPIDLSMKRVSCDFLGL
jgi:hypothetical protein